MFSHHVPLSVFRPGIRAIIAAAFALAVLPGLAQTSRRYALILSEPPVASQVGSREEVESPHGKALRSHIESVQGALKTELARRHVVVTGSVSIGLNAVFVAT